MMAICTHELAAIVGAMLALSGYAVVKVGADAERRAELVPEIEGELMAFAEKAGGQPVRLDARKLAARIAGML